MNYQISLITKNADESSIAERAIENISGKIINIQSLGQRNLLLPIQEQRSGFYFNINFEMNPSNFDELRLRLNNQESVIRYLIVAQSPQKPTPSIQNDAGKIAPPKVAQATPLLPQKVSKVVKEKARREEEKDKKERLKKLEKKLEEIFKSG